MQGVKYANIIMDNIIADKHENKDAFCWISTQPVASPLSLPHRKIMKTLDSHITTYILYFQQRYDTEMICPFFSPLSIVHYMIFIEWLRMHWLLPSAGCWHRHLSMLALLVHLVPFHLLCLSFFFKICTLLGLCTHFPSVLSVSLDFLLDLFYLFNAKLWNSKKCSPLAACCTSSKINNYPILD